MLCLEFCIGLPMGIWCLVTLYKDWNKIYITKRRRVFVVTFFVCLCFILYGYTTTGFFIHYFLYEPINFGPNIGVIFVPVIVLATWIGPCRFWIFYYDSRLAQFDTNKEWKMAIDPIKESDNWYVKHINKYGNAQFIFNVSIIFVIIEVSMQYILIFFVDEKLSPWPKQYIFSNIWLAIIQLVPAGISTCIFYKIVKEISQDNLGILKEIKFECLGCLVSAIYVTILVIILKPKYYRLIYTSICVIITPIIMYLAFIYPQRLFRKYSNRPVNLIIKKLDQEIQKQSKNNGMGSGSGSGSGANSPKSGLKTWKNIVSTYDGYVAFMTHLGKEFSTENLLFVQEVIFCILLFFFS